MLDREGAKHSIYFNVITKASTVVPRHPDVRESTVKEICKQLGIPKI